MIKKLLFFLFVSILFCRNHDLNYSFNEFGISLFKDINSKSDSSFMVSPASISYALMMVNYGASGNTSDQILSTLNIDQKQNNIKTKVFPGPWTCFVICHIVLVCVLAGRASRHHSPRLRPSRNRSRRNRSMNISTDQDRTK